MGNMKKKTITIDPVTRIEGHAKITIDLDKNGKVDDAKIHVTQYRGFEKFCEGRMYTEMPALTSRTCGICPVSHAIASTKACDEILAVKPPQAGINLRKIINLAQIVQSHTLNFFHLSSPDFVYGFDADPKDRNIFNMMQTHPSFVKDGIELRSFGQKIIEELAGKKIHPDGIIAGGVKLKLKEETKDKILSQIPQAKKIALSALKYFTDNMKKFKEELDSFANFPSLFMALVDKNGNLEHYDGVLKFIDANGKVLENGIDPKFYKDYIGEAVENDSYLKSPYYKPLGYPHGMYRVGALARLNIANACGTPIADIELKKFKALNYGKPVLNSFYYHYARLIEILYGIEKIEELLNNPQTLSDNVKIINNVSSNKGIGCSEAPRGTLFHDYEVTNDGVITSVNLIIATGNNSLAMNAGVKQVAQIFIDSKNITDGALNRVEAVIRCFDPCLSCSTHALGVVSSKIEIRDHNKKIIEVIDRS